MKPPLRILHLEDNPNDAALCRRMLLSEGLDVAITVVEGAAGFRAALARGGFDLILGDYSLPDYDGKTALLESRQFCPPVPFIFVSGELGEEAAIEAMKTGATDYVLKVRMARLVPAVRRAVAEAEARTERMLAEERAKERDELLRAVMGSLSAHVAVVDVRGVIQTVNAAWTKFGQDNKPGDSIRAGVGMNYLEICRQAAVSRLETSAIATGIESVLAGQLPEFVLEYSCHSSSEQRWFLLYVTPLNGGRGGAVLSHVDISDRKLAELHLRRMEQRLRQTERLVSLGELAASVLSEIENTATRAAEVGQAADVPSKDFNDLLGHYEQLVKSAKVESSPSALVHGSESPSAQINERVMLDLCKLLAGLADFKPTAEITSSADKTIEIDQQDRLLAALHETVEVLEATKRSFKSKPLGRLRAKLETLIRSQ